MAAPPPSAAPILLRTLVRSARELAAAPSLKLLIDGGVVRQTPRSRQLASLQTRLVEAEERGGPRRVVAAAVRGFASRSAEEGFEADALDEGFRWLRRLNEASLQLSELGETGAAEPRRRRPDVRYGVGKILFHKNHGSCCVYGWEASSASLSEASRDDLDGDIVDNRRFFNGLDPGCSCSTKPHYRCLFHDGAARCCSEDLLEDPGLRPADCKIAGASYFFKDATDERLVPNESLARLYPDDCRDEPADLEDSASYAVAWMRARRNLYKR